MKCDGKCFECKYSDCISDETDIYDPIQDKLDKEVLREQFVDKTSRQESYYKYNHSYKGKQNQKRYYSTEHGKAIRNKNVKEYYKKNREKILAKLRTPEEREKSKIRARNYRARKKFEQAQLKEQEVK